MGDVESHRMTLRERHTDLDRQIEEEMKRPSPDSVIIATLKKQKLLVKQELEAI